MVSLVPGEIHRHGLAGHPDRLAAPVLEDHRQGPLEGHDEPAGHAAVLGDRERKRAIGIDAGRGPEEIAHRGLDLAPGEAVADDVEDGLPQTRVQVVGPQSQPEALEGAGAFEGEHAPLLPGSEVDLESLGRLGRRRGRTGIGIGQDGGDAVDRRAERGDVRGPEGLDGRAREIAADPDVIEMDLVELADPDDAETFGERNGGVGSIALIDGGPEALGVDRSHFREDVIGPAEKGSASPS